MLAVDIGNTNVVCGLFDGDRLVTTFRLATRYDSTPDEYEFLLFGLLRSRNVAVEEIGAAVVCSVVPALTEMLVSVLQSKFDTLVLGPGVKTGISIAYETPKDVGADRVANAVAAHHLFGASTIVVDFGTATTFDAVTAKGEYLGGVIVPGVKVSLDALFTHTAKLPRVDVGRPSSVIGRNTVHSIQSGVFYGHVALVEGMVERMSKELPRPVRTVATGGLAPLICSELSCIERVEPHLTLHGLRLVYERNRSR